MHKFLSKHQIDALFLPVTQLYMGISLVLLADIRQAATIIKLITVSTGTRSAFLVLSHNIVLNSPFPAAAIIPTNLNNR